MRALPAPPLLVITDRLSANGSLPDVATQLFEAGCRWLMVREKDLATAELGVLAGEIVQIARPYGACVVVNGDWQAAMAAGASGVHLQAAGDIAAAREAMGDGALMGLSCHTGEDLQAARVACADYITISPVFMTESKPGYGPALGIEGLRTLCATFPGPVVALAGISPDNAARCLDAGAAGVAVMGGIMRSDNPADATRRMLHSIGA